MRPTLILLVLAIICGVLAIIVHDPPPEERLEVVAEEIQRAMGDSQELLRHEVDMIARDASGKSCDDLRAGSVILPRQRAQRDELGIEYRVTCDSLLVAWSGNAPVEVFGDGVRAVIRNANGVWAHAGARAGADAEVHGLRAIWYEVPFENRYLRGHFHPSLDVEEGIAASLGPGLGPVVRDRAGDVLFRLQWTGDVAPPGVRARWRLLFVLVCAVCALTAVWTALSRMAVRGRSWTAMGVMLAVVGCAKSANAVFGPPSVLSGFAWADPDLFASSVLLPSFADLLLTVALLVFVCAFLRHALLFALPSRRPTITTGITLLILIAFAAGINEVMIALVRDSRIPLDLFHAQSLDAASAVALLAIAFLLFAWVLLADGLVRWLSPVGEERTVLIVTLIAFAAAHLVHHLFGDFDSVLVLWPVPVLFTLWRMRRGRSRMANALVLISALSLFTVHVLNRQTFKRNERDRAALAESAVTHEDPIVEWLFREARSAMAADKGTLALLGDSVPLSSAELDARLRQPFFDGEWNNYEVRLHLFDARGRARGSTSSEGMPRLADLRARFEQGVPVEGDNTLRNVHRPVERALYIGALDIGANGRLIVELLPRVLPEGLGFPELLMAGDRAVERRTDRYARAHYERGTLLESRGDFSFPTRWTTPIPPDGSLSEQDGYELFASGDARNSLMVVASRLPTWLDHATTFSYLFILFALLGGGFLLLRTALAWRGLPPFGVATKLRAGILLMACIAIALFAFGARHLLATDLDTRTSQQLDERSRSAIAELRQHVHADADIAPALYADVDHWLDKTSGVLLTDITAYAPDGQLMATSREQVFNNGLLGKRMDPDAYMAMAVGHRSTFTHTERIGGAEFLAAYRPLLNDRGDVLAYLAIPYFARQTEVEEARATGFVAIVNLFVLLFLIGIGAATVIATWATRPLSALKRGLERVQLGAPNEHLPYQGEDELGELVRVYNRKVEELRESAEKLARSERESAWKEMARQVAHEIKNPLTPMKLGIQHFQLTWDPQALDAKERLDRFTASMVEQIDALSRVAGDFSRFAQMSAAQEVKLDLNEVARSAVVLFAGEPNADITLHAAMEGPLRVKADREHVLRMFNNLLKNALQAIPQGRRGEVHVALRADGAHAIVEIRDNGTGIPEEVRDRIFEPSFTTKSSGMGLGLAMVKRMVEQAGGSVWFETRADLGTAFFLSFPLVR